MPANDNMPMLTTCHELLSQSQYLLDHLTFFEDNAELLTPEENRRWLQASKLVVTMHTRLLQILVEENSVLVDNIEGFASRIFKED